MTTSLTIPRSVMGFRISGSCTLFSALRTSSTRGSCWVLVTPSMLRAGMSAVGFGLPGLDVEVLPQPVQLAAQVVPRGHLADGEPQRRQFPGQVLRVGLRLQGPVPVFLQGDAVAVVLPVLREQDQ